VSDQTMIRTPDFQIRAVVQ